MTTCTVTLRTALTIAKHRKKMIPRWKRWRLRNPEKDKEQRAAYYRRNRDKIAANSRIRYLKEKGGQTGLNKRTETGDIEGSDIMLSSDIAVYFCFEVNIRVFRQTRG